MELPEPLDFEDQDFGIDSEEDVCPECGENPCECEEEEEEGD